MSAPPVRGPNGAIPTANGWRRAARTCSTAPRWSRTSRRCRTCEPDLALGTTPLVQKAKSLGIPALYFTNMVSARPLFGAGRRGRAGRHRGGADPRRRAFRPHGRVLRRVGSGESAGYGWNDVPKEPAGSRERTASARGQAPRRRPTRRWGAEPCSCSTMIALAATGARSMPSPRCAACASSSTARWAARTCR